MRRCWTCNTDHDIDAACPRSMHGVTVAAAGGHLSDDLFDDAPDHRLGPVFIAQYETEDACCGEGIEPGDRIRADGGGGWIHAREECER